MDDVTAQARPKSLDHQRLKGGGKGMHDLKQPRSRRRRRTGWRRRKADVNIHAFISVASPKWVQVISVPKASNSGSIQNWQSLVGLGQSRRHQVIKKETTTSRRAESEISPSLLPAKTNV